MLFSLSELGILIEAVGALEAEFGERAERSALLVRLKELREELRVECERSR